MKFPLVESIIWSIVVILFIIIFILVVYLKILRSNIRINFRKNTNYTSIVERLLIDYLYAEKEGVLISKKQQKIINKFKKGFLSKRKQKIIITTFYNLSKEISGNMIDSMDKLYQEVGLPGHSVKKLRSKRWNIVASGIKDLRHFEFKRPQKLVEKFINHPREEVRREAYLYFVQLFEFEGLSFLDHLKAPLSEWDQIQLLGEIEKFDNQQIGDVSNWLQSSNEYVILFVLKIVKLFNCLETKDILLDLLHHKNIEIRLVAIDTLTHFEVTEAKEFLKTNIANLSEKELIAFFTLLEKTANSKDGLFVVNYTSHPNFEIQYKALKVLQKVDKNLYNKLEKQSQDHSYNEIINFLDYSYGV